jgi:MoCo/4Fe-4S cofactor protein with predicted Tat translocation signal
MDKKKYGLTDSELNGNPSDSINPEKSENKDPNYWRSFRELYDDPEFIKAREDEFADGAPEGFDIKNLSVLSRRRFLTLMAASAALAAAGCSDYKDKGEIVPYNKKPEEITLGIPNFYASTCTGCNNACGILVKAREGRPIKIDGNKEHPVSKGKICSRGQASILNLYDPGRLKEPVYSIERKNHTPVSWQNADEKIMTELKNTVTAGKEIALVTHKVISPSYKKLLDDFTSAYPTARVYSYEYTDDSARNSAWNKCYPSAAGNKLFPVIKWDEAKVILSLESDFLGSEGNVIEQTRMYSQNRDLVNGKELNRLYTVEGAADLTGFNSDYRIRLRTDAIEDFAMCLLNEFVVKRKISGLVPMSHRDFALDSKVIQVLQKYSLDDFIKKYSLDKDIIGQLVKDLAKNQDSSLVYAGSKLTESTHIAVNLLNEVLGNTKLYSQDSACIDILPLSSKSDLENLVSDMNSGKVGVLIHLDTNPVYHLAPDYNYTDALAKVPLVISMVELLNDTSDYSHYNLAVNNMLESWGDYKTRTGFYSTQQPLIAPLYNTRQKEAILLTWIKGNKDAYSEKLYHEYVMANWEKTVYPSINTMLDFKKFWYTALHDGVALVNEKPEAAGNFSSDAFAGSNRMTASNDYVLLLQENHNLGDGRFANNGWLQELPHPVSKVVWDNYAALSVQTALDLGLNNNDKVEISVDGRKAELPVLIQPGLADKVIEVQLGYGRVNAGEIGSGVGVNAGVLMTKNFPLNSRLYNNAKASKASGTYEVVSTMEHFAIDNTILGEKLEGIQTKRKIIQRGTLEEYKADPDFLHEEKLEAPLISISKTYNYTNPKWGMSIDLNKCTGCGACITACSVENNIPIVGKDQVKVNREMMWIRVDRYYSGSPDSPDADFQIMLCQHCDNAPCENVCPVAATNHSPDGLNQMIYNRCVGTRYCSNNCPYKVRRFNYFNFRDHLKDGYYEQDSVSLIYNPEVTVRSRGVMEKCTFCIQRIMDEKQKAFEQNRPVNGDNVITACQDACPAYAIQFGDTSNKENKIVKYREHKLGYHVLEEINVRPNVTYIAKLRNIKPEKAE